MPEKKPRRTRNDGQPDRRGAKPGQRGQQKFEPTEQQRQMVKTFAAMGMPHEAICLQFRPEIISPDCLTKYFADELAFGLDEANAKVAGVMFSMATDPSHKDCQRANQFWLMARAGWKTREERLHNFTPDLSPDVKAEAKAADTIQPHKITIEFGGRKTVDMPGAPESFDTDKIA